MRRLARNVGLVLNYWRTRTLWACGLALLMILGTAATPDASPGQIIYVQSKGTEVHAEPSRKAQVIAQLPQGHKVIEFERHSGWVRIGMFDTSGRDGWVHAPLLGPEPPGSRPAPPPPTAQAKEPAKEKQKDPAVHTFVIEVTGQRRLKIKGRCRVVNKSGAIERGTFRASVPAQFHVIGTAANCTVQMLGKTVRILGRGRTALMKVRLLVGNRVIAARQARRFFSYIRVRSAGPWGKAGAFKGGGRPYQPRLKPPLPRFTPVPKPSPRLRLRRRD